MKWSLNVKLSIAQRLAIKRVYLTSDSLSDIAKVPYLHNLKLPMPQACLIAACTLVLATLHFKFS